jgi:hypothetical protein
MVTVLKNMITVSKNKKWFKNKLYRRFGDMFCRLALKRKYNRITQLVHKKNKMKLMRSFYFNINNCCKTNELFIRTNFSTTMKYLWMLIILTLFRRFFSANAYGQFKRGVILTKEQKIVDELGQGHPACAEVNFDENSVTISSNLTNSLCPTVISKTGETLKNYEITNLGKKTGLVPWGRSLTCDASNFEVRGMLQEDFKKREEEIKFYEKKNKQNHEQKNHVKED